jgi:hypothetical protein
MKYHNDLDHERSPRYSTAEEAYFGELIKNSDDECWGWSGKFHDYGYGALRYKPKKWTAHRYSYTYHVGEIPNGMFVCHHCDNPVCTNPKHLFLGTHQDNMNDMLNKGRGRWQK